MDRYRGLLDRYVELYNAGDLDGVMDLYAEDAVQLMPDGTFEGRAAIKDRLAKELAAFADIAHRYVSYVEEGDAFADEWVFAGHAHRSAAPARRHRAGWHGQAGGDAGHGIRAGPRREDRGRQPLLRQLGGCRPVRPSATTRHGVVKGQTMPAADFGHKVVRVIYLGQVPKTV